MRHELRESGGVRYLFLPPQGEPIADGRDGQDIVALCKERDIELVLLHGERLTDDFLRLRTGVAGDILRDFTRCGIRAAAILDTRRFRDRFNGLLRAIGRTDAFGVYDTYDAAERWLTS